MASSTPYIWSFDLFPNYYGPDVGKTFLSHLRRQFNENEITMFDDQEIERGRTMGPELAISIRESRISIIVLSKNYASSSCCLDELLEILKCKEDKKQIVMTVFYGVDPSDVRKQTGEFGEVFDKTCETEEERQRWGRALYDLGKIAGEHSLNWKTEEKRRMWSQALTDVGNIAGYHFLSWDDESEMIEKIARDVSKKLDLEDVEGIEVHLEKMQSLLHLKDDVDGAMMVGITGPAGIGKTTIARALHSRHASSFQLTCFMENIRGSYNSGPGDYGLKLCLLQEELLSNIFNRNMRKYHLQESLCDLKVLIILDGVDDLKQLEALANKTTWFGPGSRIIVTTEDEELLKQHDINKTYHVDFPSSEEALQILCRYAFRTSYPYIGFEELAKSVVNLCDKLPLRLRAVGSSLRGKNKEEWENLKRTLVDRRAAEQVQTKSKGRYSTPMAFLVINFLLEIASAVSDQLSSIRKPYFARISLVMSLLSVVLSILDLACKIRASNEACFRCEWPIPWFYHKKFGYWRIIGSFTDRVLLFCAVGQLIVSTINFSFTERRRDGPIKVSVWPLFFAFAMVASKFMEKKPISKQN